MFSHHFVNSYLFLLQSFDLSYSDGPLFNPDSETGLHFGGHPRPSRPYLGTPFPPNFAFGPANAPPLRATPMPHLLDRIPKPGVSTFQKYLLSGNAAYPMLLTHATNSANEGRRMLAGNRMNTLSEGTRRVPPFPGAAVAFEPSSNTRGSVQLISTDRGEYTLSLPIVSHPSEMREVPANTQAMLIRSGDGIFLRLSNGLLLNAQDSIYDT
ncbi:hypothetical protein NECAME_16721, partial [Necator americanus]